MRKIFFVILLFLIVGCIEQPTNRLMQAHEPAPGSREQTMIHTNTACFQNKRCVEIERAETPEERARGLMFREQLDKNAGMLFIFPQEGKYSFWMKNTLIPLDIVWINHMGKIVFIAENVPPCAEEPCPSISPEKNAQYVLELNAGVAAQNNVRVDQMVYLNYSPGDA